MNMKYSAIIPLIAAGIVILTAGPAFAVQTYLITDLGNLGGGTASAVAINNSNQVAGTATLTNPGFDAFLFANGVMHDLGNLGGDSSATAINGLGHVVGSSDLTVTTTTNHAFLYRSGALMDLGLPAGFNTAVANGVNDFDQVVGQLISGPRRQTVSHAFVWQNGAYRDIGTLGGNGATAAAINNSAQIVGSSAVASGALHAFVWQNGVMTDLGVLPGGFSSSAAAINNNGEVVGSSGTTNFGPSHAVVFRGGAVTDLGVPVGFTSSAANAVNSQGVVVGSAAIGSYGRIVHAFVAANGAITDLNRLIPGNSGGWLLQSANGVNDVGVIVGTGTTNGVQHAFLLTPTSAVTEPAAPINLAEVTGNRSVGLSWMESFGATTYNVKRSTSSNGPFATIAAVTGTNITDTSVINCTVYSYAVSAVNSAGESPNSSTVSANPQSVPAAPSNLTAAPNTQQNLFDGSAIVLAWRNNAATCSVSVVIERCTDGVNFQPAFTLGANQNTTVDGFLNSGTRYFYRVRSQSTGGESGPSNIASAVAP
jgi:probable HAF family extracellular repeat protein